MIIYYKPTSSVSELQFCTLDIYFNQFVGLSDVDIHSEN